jgi:hypothetical protein
MRTLSWMCSVAVVAAMSAACGSVSNKTDAAVPIDAAVDAEIDAAIDAPIDAIDAPMTPPGAELNSAGGRMTGTTFTLDVQLGHPFSQQQIQGATLRLEGNNPIKP